MTVAWTIPITYILYLMGLMIQNGFNSYANKPLMSYGMLTSWWFIFTMFIITVVIDVLLTTVEVKIKDI